MAWHPFRNLGLKFLALALGTVLWFMVSGERVVERSVRVPLEFRNVPATFELTGPPVETVSVRLRGASGQLGHLGTGDVLAFIDFAGAPEGPHVVQLRPDQVTAPFGVEVVQVLTPSVAVDLERTGTVACEVAPTIDGEPADGHTRGDTTVTPARVEVSGPERRLRELRLLATEPVSIAGASKTVTRSVNLVVSDPGLRLRDVRQVTVTVVIK
jgi:hypothetical protein